MDRRQRRGARQLTVDTEEARRGSAGRLETEHQHSAGGLVGRGDEALLIALKGGDRWQIPKGHVEAGETVEQAAVREVEEETGVLGRPLGQLPSIEYWFVEDGKRIHKRVDFFLLDYLAGTSADYDPREVSGAEWLPWDEVVERLSFSNEKRVSETARDEWRRRQDEVAGTEGS